MFVLDLFIEISILHNIIVPINEYLIATEKWNKKNDIDNTEWNFFFLDIRSGIPIVFPLGIYIQKKKKKHESNCTQFYL